MNSLKRYLLFGAAMVSASVMVATAIQRRSQEPGASLSVQRFHVRGEVREVDQAGKSIRIRHEAILDYMAAMTMAFSVRDITLLRGIEAGDEIGFTLVVTKEDSWIETLSKLTSNNSSAMSSKADALEPSAGRVQVGESVPDFALTDQTGKRVRLSDFRGKAVLLTFIYTRCPLPNFCPLLSKNFSALQERFQKHFPGNFQLVSVSIDPQFDRPEVLKDYAARFTNDDRTWTFGTGTTEECDAVGALFGLVQERAGGLVNHDLRTALIGPDGRLVHLWKSNVWTPFEVQRRVDEVLNRRG